jgi:hypothetical protein
MRGATNNPGEAFHPLSGLPVPPGCKVSVSAYTKTLARIWVGTSLYCSSQGVKSADSARSLSHKPTTSAVLAVVLYSLPPPGMAGYSRVRSEWRGIDDAQDILYCSLGRRPGTKDGNGVSSGYLWFGECAET